MSFSQITTALNTNMCIISIYLTKYQHLFSDVFTFLEEIVFPARLRYIIHQPNKKETILRQKGEHAVYIENHFFKLYKIIITLHFTHILKDCYGTKFISILSLKKTKQAVDIKLVNGMIKY